MGVHEVQHQVSEAAGQIWRVPMFGRNDGVTAEQKFRIVRTEDIGDELLGRKPDDTVCYVTQHDHPVFFAEVCKKFFCANHSEVALVQRKHFFSRGWVEMLLCDNLGFERHSNPPSMCGMSAGASDLKNASPSSQHTQ